MDFKNENELKRFLLSKCKAAIAITEQKVYKIINDCLEQFYDEFAPDEYIRTGQLLRSLVKTDVSSTANGYQAEVYFDVSMLDYQTGYVPLQHTSEHGMYGWATWTGQKVLDVAMTDGLPHGRYAEGTAIWTESRIRLGNIIELLKQELVKQGIPIR